jgi:hypothetical protein
LITNKSANKVSIQQKLVNLLLIYLYCFSKNKTG